MSAHGALGLAGVEKRFGATRAVRALDLEVARGEVVSVVGESGCGKSTLLRLVAGLEHPDAGTITIAGHVVADARKALPPEKRRAGLVFQDHALFPHLDVAANIAFGLRGLGPVDRERRVAEVLELVGLGLLARRHPHELSGGEQQRVALARALAPRPEVVLLDEPFSSLDENLRARVRVETLAVLRETGSAALVVTHDQDEALMMGDRLAVMRAGAIEQVDTPARVYEQPATRYAATFMGDADFLPARVVREALETELGPVPTPSGGRPAGDVEVMLRPHQIALETDPAGAGTVERVEYHGAYTLHEVRLDSGRVVRSRQPGERLPVGATVRVVVLPGVRPVVVDSAGDAPNQRAPRPHLA